ncbi:2-dehydro-3-deoxygalactonokinase [Bradyrhizobium sp. INPA01-394B]|uniref:2-dehydro-3-deoxygalactonokinase n=1 Tax=Bradyrhizobium campsiandrae TaxID=1729892 RepID=A0ABR7UCW4_9BRAD|nr:2-dehydro-3-deoxygalactonokinase [Bradyrhizobium campsiandrae]MBC9877274.1 2-dehydro-3-deoxygalactonokinase [Bradyrhizobium campsiandrae]MBC9981374.1 2-dehydro-3-deoxygalactonokinase [Bradyrhizobium campsiandrae]
MTEPAFVAVDWGTSSFRLWLVDRTGQVLAERRSDEGMLAAAKAGFSGVLQAHLSAVAAPDRLPVLVCGMAGAKTGWIEAGYVDTPAPLAAVLKQAARVPGEARDIRILPGIAQRDPKAPDVMRGEETQLLGALGLEAAGEALVCMPGTHSKWVRVKNGAVERFSTFMTGELFSVVSRETILSLAVAGADEAEDVATFKAAVTEAFEAPAFAANLLFTARSRQLLFGATPAAARETLSGTLIGAELAAGLSIGLPKAGITLIASGRLAALYRHAFDALSVTVNPIDADEAVRRGLSMASAAIWTK